MELNYDEYSEKVAKRLADVPTMALATGNKSIDFRNRMVSVVTVGDQLGRIYFQSSTTLQKIREIKENNIVALTTNDGISIRGVAKILGHPLDEKNLDVMEHYVAKHPDSFQKYSFLPDEVLIEVEIGSMKIWTYVDGVPYIDSVNVREQVATREDSEDTKHMHLYPESFDRIVSGEKVTEFRLNDPKRQKIRLGDYIVFERKHSDSEPAEYRYADTFCTVRVTNLEFFDTFRAMYEKYWDQEGYALRYDSMEACLADNPSSYTREKEKEYGCVAISFSNPTVRTLPRGFGKSGTTAE